MISSIKCKKFKLFALLSAFIAVSVGAMFFIYLWLIPKIVASHKFQSFVDGTLFKYMNVNMVTKDVRLKTGIPNISFQAELFKLTKNNKEILALKNIDTEFSVSKIKRKKIIAKRLGADYIFVDVNKLLAILPKQEKKQEKSAWYVDLTKSYLYLKDLKILYNANNIYFDISAKNISMDNSQTDKKYLHFDFNGKVSKSGHSVTAKIKDNNKFYIKDNEINIEPSILALNKSILKLSGIIKDDKKYNINISAKGFDISNITAIIESNLFISNGSEMLSYFDNIDGDFNFNFNATQKGITGNVDLHHLCFLLIPVEKVPVHIHKGNIIIDKKNIHLKNFAGYYGSKPVNTMKFEGIIKDYMKTFNAHITADGVIADDFAKYYLSPVIGIPINIVGKADTRLIIDCVNNVIKLKWFFRMSPEDNLLVSGEPISKYKEKRVIVSNMTIEGALLRIKNLDYYVTVPGVKEFFRRKLISLHGLIDFSKGVDFRVMGFKIEKPVPSGFLNIIARHEIFKDGTAVGNLTAVDGPKGVKLFGNLTLNEIKIPSQRLFVKSANISTNFDTINVKAEGGYRRSKYELSGNMENRLSFPLVVNSLNFSLDNMDVKKLLNSFNYQSDSTETTKSIPEEDDETPTFDITNIIIKDCNLKLGKAVYNELSAENMEAKMTLDEIGELDLNSNKFDFAQGHSSAHVCCDLKNHKYHVKLGVKDVDSNLIATGLLNLPKEISGKSSGILDLNTDDTMKLNGTIKFLIKKGTIGKIGLIEYVLHVASVFRNPIAMISPMTIFDLINIPNGEFDKIQGTLDITNNIIESIKIKSYAPYLSAYICGNYNLEKQDASLRIYTKLTNKKKGIYGFLRSLSLSNIASRVSLGARNDVNYYSSEIAEIPQIEADETDCQIFLTTVDGDVEHFNFLSSLKKLK